MGIALALETAGGIRSVGWFEETENRLNKDRPTQFWTRLDRMTESVAIAERSTGCCDDFPTFRCTYFAIGSRENRVAENGIGPAPVIPEQTGLRKRYWAKQFRYQYKPDPVCWCSTYGVGAPNEDDGIANSRVERYISSANSQPGRADKEL